MLTYFVAGSLTIPGLKQTPGDFSKILWVGYYFSKTFCLLCLKVSLVNIAYAHDNLKIMILTRLRSNAL